MSVGSCYGQKLRGTAAFEVDKWSDVLCRRLALLGM